MFFKLLFIDQIADSVTHCVTCSDKKKTITALADGKCVVNGLFRLLFDGTQRQNHHRRKSLFANCRYLELKSSSISSVSSPNTSNHGRNESRKAPSRMISTTRQIIMNSFFQKHTEKGAAPVGRSATRAKPPRKSPSHLF